MPDAIAPLDQLEVLARSVEHDVLTSPAEVEAYRLRYLSRKQGLITDLLKQIPRVEPDRRREFGAAVNRLKERAEARLAEAEALQTPTLGTAVEIDLTLPGRRPAPGSLHPITQARREIERVFTSFGFTIAEGSEIEDDWHNFTALNFKPDHPARDMQDTFFIEAPTGPGTGVFLRTHTSPVQIRLMENRQPPIRVIIPGRVYRNEAISYKSFCLFHQMEGLVVAEGVNMAELKQVLHAFAVELFGADVRMRFRPSFFPFTEPSAEVDIWWKDDRLPDGGRWLEILGCGMVDPAVLENVGVDSERYTGYAFGMGIERIAMLRFGITDIRVLYENDARFLEQFA